MRIGFAGLGAIGRPIAGRLAAAHELAVWNRTTARAEAFAAETGAVATATPRAVAEDRDVVFTCLPNSPEVAALLEGPDGLEAGLGHGAVLVDLTSGVPSRSREIAERLRKRGVGFLDAPVSGGVAGAEAGTLTVMVGGEAEQLERVRPVLETFGRTIVHVGPVGAGDALKAVHNSLIAVHVVALAEGLSALARFGVAPATALEVINQANGRSFVSQVLFPERVLTGAWPRTFRLALLDKDVSIAQTLFTDLGLQAPVIDAARGELEAALAELGHEADHVEAVRAIERRAGVELRA